MSLIITDDVLDVNSTSYAANTVLEVPSDVANWVASLSGKGRKIVAGPNAWTAVTFAPNNLVSNLGQYWVNGVPADGTDIPGTSGKWVAVTYLPAQTNIGDVVTPGGFSGSGDNYKFENNKLYVKNPDTGAFALPGFSINDGQPVPIVQ